MNRLVSFRSILFPFVAVALAVILGMSAAQDTTPPVDSPPADVVSEPVAAVTPELSLPLPPPVEPETTAQDTATAPLPPMSGTTESVGNVEGNEANDTAADEEEPVEAGPPVYWKDRASTTFLAFFLVIALSYWLANTLATQWRMKDYTARYFVVLFCLIGSMVSVHLGWHRMTLGIDLSGGSMLIYNAHPTASDAQAGEDTQSYDDETASRSLVTSRRRLDSQTMEALQRALKRRVDPSGVREISITQLGMNQIKIVIPQAEDAEVTRIQRVIAESGTLEFRILASTLYDEDKDIIDRASKSPATYLNDGDGNLLAFWAPVTQKEQNVVAGYHATRVVGDHLEVLVLKDDYDVKGGDLRRIYQTIDHKTSQEALGFELNGDGSRRFGMLTGLNMSNPAQPNIRRQLGILMNGELYSAPNLDERITGSGIITFGVRHTAEERLQLQRQILDLINVMQAGALPAELEPASNQRVGAMLGRDTVEKGSTAITWGAICVLIFMVVYYRFAGVVACFCVVMNLLMIVAVMLSIHAAFTLPGLAGLVLTIGMAVDANILIFERIREELSAGSSLRMAIRNGFDRALSAIVDSNVTTLITAVILYAVGSEQIKGFAVTLFLGVSFSMFTAIFCSRAIFDTAERTGFLKSLTFLQLISRPNINFLGIRNQMLGASAICVLICIAGMLARGTGILDIDFVGGVSVEMMLKEPVSDDEVRNKLKGLPDLAVTNIQMDTATAEVEAAETGGSALPNTRYIINTSSPIGVEGKEHIKTVAETIKTAFGDKLVYSTVDTEIVSATPIAGSGGSDSSDDVATSTVEEDTATTSTTAARRNKYVMKLTYKPEINAPSMESDVKAAITAAHRRGDISAEFPIEIMWAGYDRAAGDTVRHAEWTITTETPAGEMEKFLQNYQETYSSTPHFPTSTTIGSTVAGHTRNQAILAVLASLVAIVVYMRIRFRNLMFGLAAVIGLVFNVLITLGLLAISKWLVIFLAPFGINEFKIGLPVIAAFLTIIGYSLNDTIILFDRIREVRGKLPKLTLDIINTSINQTLSRTILTSLTTFFTVFVLYTFGGQGIHTFAFAMCVGIAVGTFGTIFISAPMLYLLTNENKK